MKKAKLLCALIAIPLALLALTGCAGGSGVIVGTPGSGGSTTIAVVNSSNHNLMVIVNDSNGRQTVVECLKPRESYTITRRTILGGSASFSIDVIAHSNEQSLSASSPPIYIYPDQSVTYPTWHVEDWDLR